MECWGHRRCFDFGRGVRNLCSGGWNLVLLRSGMCFGLVFGVLSWGSSRWLVLVRNVRDLSRCRDFNLYRSVDLSRYCVRVGLRGGRNIPRWGLGGYRNLDIGGGSRNLDLIGSSMNFGLIGSSRNLGFSGGRRNFDLVGSGSFIPSGGGRHLDLIDSQRNLDLIGCSRNLDLSGSRRNFNLFCGNRNFGLVFCRRLECCGRRRCFYFGGGIGNLFSGGWILVLLRYGRYFGLVFGVLSWSSSKCLDFSIGDVPLGLGRSGGSGVISGCLVLNRRELDPSDDLSRRSSSEQDLDLSSVDGSRGLTMATAEP